MLLADQRRPQHVVDAAIEDDDVPSRRRVLRSTTRATDTRRPARPGNGRAPGGAAHRPGPGPTSQAATIAASPRPEPDQVERFLVWLVRDPEPAAGVDRAATGRPQPHRQAPRPCGPWRRRARRAPPRRARSTPRTRAARAGRDGPRRPPSRGRDPRSAASIPNLPAPSSPTRRTRSRRACLRDTAARSRTGWRRPAAGGDGLQACSSPGDSTVIARTPAPRPRPQLVVALARAGHRRPARRRCRRERTVASSPADATSAPSPRRPEMRHDARGPGSP